MDTPDKLTLTTKDNPELAALFANKQPGDKCKLELEVQLDEKTPDGVTCSVDSAAPVEYSAEEEGEPGNTPEEESAEGEGTKEPAPVMIAMMGKMKGKPKGEPAQA